MGIILVALASLGLLCVCANLLEMIGKVVIGILQYVVKPILIFMMILFLFYCLTK